MIGLYDASFICFRWVTYFMVNLNVFISGLKVESDVK